MSHVLNQDQQMFQDAVRAWLRANYGWEARSRAIVGDPGFRPDVWQAFAVELGLCGLGFAVEDGGIDASGTDMLAVIEPMGEFAVIEPFIDTLVLAGRLLRTVQGARAKALVGRIVSGDAIVACALGEERTRVDFTRVETLLSGSGGALTLVGRKALVSAAPWATDLLVSARGDSGALALVHLPADAPGITWRPCRTIDGRRAAELTFTATPVPEDAVLPLPDAGGVIDAAIDAAIGAICCEAIGLLSTMLAITVAHTRERRQFGQPLASFQALQHRMADMKIALEKATAATYAAMARLDDQPAARAASISVAKIATGRACKVVGQGAVQLHGGMGMTAELPIGQYFQRATVIERLFGDTDDHILRLDAIDNHGLI